MTPRETSKRQWQQWLDDARRWERITKEAKEAAEAEFERWMAEEVKKAEAEDRAMRLAEIERWLACIADLNDDPDDPPLI